MNATPLAIRCTGLVTSVGLTAPASCAAFRAKLSNPTETRFIDSAGKWVMAHQVELEKPWRGLAKLAKMAALAIDEALHEVPTDQWHTVPLLLCVAETDRPGRTERLDIALLPMIEAELGVRFAEQSAVVAHGRVSVAVALAGARKLLSEGPARRVLVAAADSYLNWETLRQLEEEDQLLTSENSDGFIPGEGAGALLVEKAHDLAGPLTCIGIGFGIEAAHAASERPLRADGLCKAVTQALGDAACEMRDLHFRIADISGQQYYFKESSLLLSRLVRHRPERFDLWHPAECAGEQGAVAGVSIIALAHAASSKQFALGPGILAHMANSAGQRAALTLRCTSTR